ncbi:MAG: glycosyltransferase family 4 protein [Rhodospirillales bacterium]|nr:glycosyltransferase family 4 protein [Rhodospirillales bacterium]
MASSDFNRLPQRVGAEGVTANCRRLIFVAPFPPQVHGQSVSTAYLYRQLTDDGVPIRKVDINRRDGNPVLMTASRLLRHLDAARRLLFDAPGPAYISVNANVGMWITAALALIGRLRGRGLLFHHHTYSHIDHEKPAARALIRFAGPAAQHILICATMSNELERRYGRIQHLELSNVTAVDPALRQNPLTDRTSPVTLGHLSNLTVEKGIKRVVDAFRAAKQAGLADKLIVAGSCVDLEAEQVVEAARAEFGEDFDHRGRVGGEAKHRFFSDIDVFLFPSLYSNETEGIVLLEALAAGKPAIAYGLCCINAILDDPSGRVVPPDAPFSPAVVDFLRSMQGRLPQVAAGAQSRFDSLLTQGQQERQRVLSVITAMLAKPRAN